jgi:DNA-binding NarL/FixJ family response regulator
MDTDLKVLLIDDHTLFREGVSLLLRPLVAQLQVWEAGSVEEAQALLQARGAPDLVLIDLVLPGQSGLEGITLIRRQWPDTPLVALSSSDDKATVLQALDAGALGFIPKTSSSAVLVAALKLVMAKGIYLPPSVFLDNSAHPQPTQPVALAESASPEMPVRQATDLGLSARQAEVLRLILQGKSAKVIARELNLSASTVKAHTSAVLRTLNVTTRTQAVVAAGRQGLRFA